MKYPDPTIQVFRDSISDNTRFINYATGCDFGGTKERFVLYGLSDQSALAYAGNQYDMAWYTMNRTDKMPLPFYSVLRCKYRGRMRRNAKECELLRK